MFYLLLHIFLCKMFKNICSSHIIRMLEDNTDQEVKGDDPIRWQLFKFTLFAFDNQDTWRTNEKFIGYSFHSFLSDSDISYVEYQIISYFYWLYDILIPRTTCPNTQQLFQRRLYSTNLLILLCRKFNLESLEHSYITHCKVWPALQLTLQLSFFYN